MSFSIHSTSSSRELIFADRRGESFKVRIAGDVSASVEVWVYPDASKPDSLFQELANYEKPWRGVKSWAAVEGEFAISATCSPLGEVVFTIQLRGLRGAPEEWRVSVGLATEFGQLSNIAQQAKSFFA